MLSLLLTPYILPFLFSLLLLRIIYNRWLHPLSSFPGPFWAPQTNLWKVYHLWSFKMPETLLALHTRHGPIVRIGPNDLSFNQADAIAPIYKAGRCMSKSSFYDGFTTFQANLFGTRDEDLHSLRRRQMAHGFSTSSLQQMEGIFDNHIGALRKRLDSHLDGSTFDLKEVIAYFAYDVIGELAFSRNFNSQEAGDPANLPPINDHIFLGCLYGMMPSLLPYSMKFANSLPLPWLRKMLESRASLRSTTAKCVSAEMSLKGQAGKNLLTRLIEAKDPETGMKLTEADVSSEAFGYLVAGSHTTSGTLTLLFFHLLHDPVIGKKLSEDLNALPLSGSTYPYNGLESALPYTLACVRENYRLTPVFTMPLPRVVGQPGGLKISGRYIPQETNVSITNHCLHRNADLWGPDHDVFIPERWTAPNSIADPNNLMPFGAGHRACIGRNIASISIMKVLTTLWRNYEFEAVDKQEVLSVTSVGISEKEGSLMCSVRRRDS